MSNLFVTIYKGMARDVVNTPVPAPEMPPLAEWSLEIGVESNQSRPFPEATKFIHVKAGGPCCLAFGKNPIADANYHPLDAGEVRWYGVYPGHKIAVIMYSEDAVVHMPPQAPMPRPFE